MTGATGLVGRAVTEVLHAKGIPVNYLTTSRDKLVSKEGIQGFLWNPAKGEINLDCFKEVQAIINLAGSPIAKRWTPLRRKKILRSRVEALECLANGLERLGTSQVECLVSASAIGIYPDSPSSFYEEDEPGTARDFLGEVVRQWEAAADRFTPLGIDVSKLRTGLVLSMEGGALPRMAFPIRNLIGAPFGNGEQWQSWIHIGDLAQMFVFMVENNLRGVYNGVAPNPVTNNKMTKELARVLDRPLWLPKVPGFVLRIILGSMAQLVLDSQRVSCKKITEEGFSFQFPNICSALEHLHAPGRENGDLSREPLHNGAV